MCALWPTTNDEPPTTFPGGFHDHENNDDRNNRTQNQDRPARAERQARARGDEKYISPSYTRSYPLVAKSGRGIVITDVDGNEFYDFSAGIAVTSTGHCHPHVVAAMQKQAGELIHMSGTDFYYESLVTLAERLSKIAPMAGPHQVLLRQLRRRGDRVRAEAGALPYQETKHDRVLRRVPWTDDGGDVADRVETAAAAPLFAAVPGVTHVSYPDLYRGRKDATQDPTLLR